MIYFFFFNELIIIIKWLMESGDNIRGTGGYERWQECMNRRETREPENC